MTEYLQSVGSIVEKVLELNPKLRELQHREKVLQVVRMYKPDAKFSTVERWIRKIQNPKYDKKGKIIYAGKYRPLKYDNRFEHQEDYRLFFATPSP